jgi:hypothetical protein
VAEVPSYWFGIGHAPRFSRNVALASLKVDEAKEALHEALKQGYPEGSEVFVIHSRGCFTGFVVGWDTWGCRVAVKNARTLKTSKWWAAHVQLVNADGVSETRHQSFGDQTLMPPSLSEEGGQDK